jgi:hypothetical protein
MLIQAEENDGETSILRFELFHQLGLLFRVVDLELRGFAFLLIDSTSRVVLELQMIQYNLGHG